MDRAHRAFAALGEATDQQITDFYGAFARRLLDDSAFAPIAEANQADVERAQARGQTSTRLVLSDKMRSDMADGLNTWRDAASGRGTVIEQAPHDGWEAQLIRSGLGVVGFVFEGRPNVFADATGVLRSGNTVVFRIGSAALGTARAIVEHALDPALAEAGFRKVRSPWWTARRERRDGRSSHNPSCLWPWPAGRARRWATGRGGPPERHLGEPPRHGRRVDGGRSERRRIPVRQGGPTLARPEGVQHPERVRAGPLESRGVGAAVPRRPRGGRPEPGRQSQAVGDRGRRGTGAFTLVPVRHGHPSRGEPRQSPSPRPFPTAGWESSGSGRRARR